MFGLYQSVLFQPIPIWLKHFGGAFRFQILRDSCKSRGKRVLVATVFLAFQRFQAVASPLFLNDSDTLGGTEKHDIFRVDMTLQFAQIRRNMPQVVMS